MRTKARRVVVVAFEEVELLDMALPLEILSTAGRRWNFRPYKVAVAAPRAGLITTRAQLRIEATEELLSAAPADIVILPGGYGARRFAEDPALVAELARIAEQAEWLGAIGSGILPLLAAGLLADGAVATSPELTPLLSAHVAAERLDHSNRLVGAGRVLTTAQSAHAGELALELVKRTLGPKLVAMVQAELGLEPSPGAGTIQIRY